MATGPDRCGSTDKVHLILQHQNPVSKEWEEKHAKDMPLSALGDRQTHLYTLIIRPDNSFEVLIDNESKKKGSLLTDMDPPVNPEKMIDDPDDKKPADWVDVAKIEDPAAKKPGARACGSPPSGALLLHYMCMQRRDLTGVI